MLILFTDEELAAQARATWTALAEVYEGEADRLDAWAVGRVGADAELAGRRARQLRQRVPSLCTLDQLGAEIDDPDLEADLGEAAA